MTGGPQRLEAGNLATSPRLRHGYFTRAGGVSRGDYASLNCGLGSGDDAQAVTENRARAVQALGANAAHLVTLYQTHSAQVAVLDAKPSDEAPRADAAVTRVADLTLGILTADCAPVLLADAGAGVIGAAHAGWRGALGGIVQATVREMTGLGAEPDHIAAAIGPCIGPASYEVGPEFYDRFMDADLETGVHFQKGRRDGHWMFDLASYVADQIRSAGVTHIELMGDDSFADAHRFFSFRRTTLAGHGDYGRNLAAICLTDDGTGGP
ncbi:MAG: peptidoglycan editing factor PgeF [Alphaproteobacteria bacterium]|nr:peptidoglycan editing factor PgeF [Alphaproteobacteria bacterium]